jgi:hypothetical protein
MSTNIKYTMTYELKSDTDSSIDLLDTNHVLDIKLLSYIIKSIIFYEYINIL